MGLAPRRDQLGVGRNSIAGTPMPKWGWGEVKGPYQAEGSAM
jgi:hypothetical protein